MQARGWFRTGLALTSPPDDLALPHPRAEPNSEGDAISADIDHYDGTPSDDQTIGTATHNTI